MNGCELALSPDIELYFYGELEEVDRNRVEAHLRKCDLCRQRLEDLHTIRRALEGRRVVAVPPGGDWSGFMRRLESAISLESAHGGHRAAGRAARSALYWAAALAAMIAIATAGTVMAPRIRQAPPPPIRDGSATAVTRQVPNAADVRAA